MATIEERITTLEHSFAGFQKEVGKSIRELNENGTIMLGLVQTILQEGRQRDLVLKLHGSRLSQVEAKVDAHTAILNAHTAKLNEHTTILNEHTAKLNEHTTILNEHTAKLDEHTAILNEHTTILNKHTARFDHVDATLAEILARLPEKA